ncbi:MAG: hypothetical protein ACRDCB_01355 [Clostridium sp.]|uniref:hypothetical protein n=1 Tax=Clostridium TaxID=1485 RepID=UPI0021530FAC|nr:hypothetical protein [Clostridium sp. LY3-2]MCR6515652.1 hypothetical protein [Clostridium sp. LY3-2]
MGNKLMENHFNEMDKLADLLKKLVESYRLLVGGAAELNNINKRKGRDVDSALDNIEHVDRTIASLLEVIECYEKNYMKYSKIKNEIIGLNNEKSKVKKELENEILTEINEDLNLQNKQQREKEEKEK